MKMPMLINCVMISMTIDYVTQAAVVGVSHQMLRDPYGSLLASSYLLADFLKHITE